MMDHILDEKSIYYLVINRRRVTFRRLSISKTIGTAATTRVLSTAAVVHANKYFNVRVIV